MPYTYYLRLLNQSRRIVPLPLDEVPPSVVIDALDRDAAGDSAAIAAMVTRALTELPPDEARLLEAFHFERCRVARLAELHGISERAVEGRLRRARERLRHILETTLPKAEGGFV